METMEAVTLDDLPAAMMEETQERRRMSHAERVAYCSMVRRALGQLRVVAKIKESAKSQAISYSQNVTDSVTNDLAEQHRMEDAFLRIMDQRTHLLTKTNRNQGKAVNCFADSSEELRALTVQLRELTFKLVTHLKQDPNVPANVKRVAMRRGELEDVLESTFEELANARDTHAIPQALHACVMGELLKLQEEAEVSRKEAEATAAVRVLQLSIRNERAKHNELMKQKVVDLANLRRKLKANKDHDATNLSYEGRTLKYANECQRRLENTRIWQLEKQKAKLIERKAIEVKDSNTVQGSLERRSTSLFGSATRWQARYDSDTVKKDKDTEMIKREQQNQLVRLKEIEGLYQEEAAKKEIRDAEEKRAKLMARINMEQGERQNRAAMKIQALYRGWKARGGKGKKVRLHASRGERHVRRAHEAEFSRRETHTNPCAPVHRCGNRKPQKKGKKGKGTGMETHPMRRRGSADARHSRGPCHTRPRHAPGKKKK